MWYFEKDSDGYDKIKSKQSGKCLDIIGISSEDGAKIQLWSDTDGDNQKWKLTRQSDDIISGGEYKLTSKRSNKAMEVENDSSDSGALIEQWDNDSARNQSWILKEVEAGYYTITSKNSGKVVDVRNRDTDDGTTIYQWDYLTQDNQLWYFEKDSEGYYKIKSKQSGKCLDISGMSTDNGAKIQLWSDVDGDNQKWTITKEKDKTLTGFKPNIDIKPDDDTDEDGIINSKELEYGTSISSIDTDGDLLTDYEEIYTYKTNPLSKDSDNDGLDDLSEVKLGLNPLSKDEVKPEYSLAVNNTSLGVSLLVNGSAKAVSTTNVDKVDDQYFSNTASIVGNVLEFTSKEKINNAKVTISYNEQEIKDKQLDEDKLSIYYINEKNLTLEKVDSVIDKNTKTISANLQHFSKYVINDHAMVQKKLDGLKGVAGGGTNIASALNKAASIFDENSRKIIILLTDGEGSGDITSAMKTIKDKNIQVYTVGLGSSVNVSLLKNTIAMPTSGQYFHANDSKNLIDAFKEIGSSLTVPKTKTITLKSDDATSTDVEVKVLADSGFKAEVDGYRFKNFNSNYGETGQCFGFSTTSILHYYNELPLDSSIMNSKVDFDYDLTDNNVFKNGMKLYDNIKVSQVGNVNYDANSDIGLSFLGEDKEAIKSIIWWNAIQDKDLKYVKGLTKLDSLHLGGINYLKNSLTNGPIEVDFSQLDGLSIGESHSVVGETLYQDKEDPTIYYLGIYDSNNPGAEEYIKIEEGHFGLSNPFKLISLKPVRCDYNWAKMFCSFDVRSLEECLK